MPDRRQRQFLKACAALGLTALGAHRNARAQSAQSQERLRALMERSRAGRAAPAALDAPTRTLGGISAERAAERVTLLEQGEAALRRIDAEAAQAAFEKAALIAHMADTEMGLVRSYMQSGAYRRALAFGAHTAGAHLDVVGGSALYAWLLHRGGQDAVAHRLLNEAAARAPDQPLIHAVQEALKRQAEPARGAMLLPPARLAPYGQMPKQRSSVVASGTLVLQGRGVLVPQVALRGAANVWVRSARGELVSAKADARVAHGLALLRLARPLGATTFTTVERPVFAGSPSFAVQHSTDETAEPAWPVLRAQFFMRSDKSPSGLGIEWSATARNPLGGPVFDRFGRIAVIAVQNIAIKSDVMSDVCSPALLTQVWGAGLFDAPDPQAPAVASTPDAIYEQALGLVVQVLRA